MKYYYSIYFSSELGKTYHTSILDHPITKEDYLKIEEDLDYETGGTGAKIIDHKLEKTEED